MNYSASATKPKAQKIILAKSRKLYERACRCLAGGVSSEFRKDGHAHPLFYERALGSHLFDVDGNDFLDFALGQGSLILGHSHPEVLEAVRRASEDGQSFAAQHCLELDLAEMLQRLVPCAELMRFSLSGSEAVHAALRLARAATGRPKFLRFEGHYHGWYDNVAVSVNGRREQDLGSREAPRKIPWSAGLPERVCEEMIVLPWNDLALLQKVIEREFAQLSAVIMEPVMCNTGCISPQPGFLQGLRSLCDRFGILLIFDEVITGFRLGMAGAQGCFGVTPDLTAFGKAMANGWPISALAGKERFMRRIATGEVIHAGTLNSGQPCVAAALATLEILRRDHVHEKLYSLGLRLMAGLRAAACQTGHHLLLQGPGPVFHAGFTQREHVNEFRHALSYDHEKYYQFAANMRERGIRLINRGIWYISAAHTESEIDETAAAAEQSLADLHP
jgi:glutamate-1-semialdehyde 2,1-aminomutase